MGQLTSSEAKRKVSEFESEIDKVAKKIQKNFEDMDFENADRRNEMENIIQEMLSDCQYVKARMDNLYFED